MAAGAQVVAKIFRAAIFQFHLAGFFDFLQGLGDGLQEVEETGKMELEDCGTKDFRYDLCPRCHKKFLKDPLGRDALRRLNFSEN